MAQGPSVLCRAARLAVIAVLVPVIPLSAAVRMGDADGNGAVSMADAQRVLRARLTPLSFCASPAAAVTAGDTVINLKDLLLIAQYASGARPASDLPGPGDIAVATVAPDALQPPRTLVDLDLLLATPVTGGCVQLDLLKADAARTGGAGSTSAVFVSDPLAESPSGGDPLANVTITAGGACAMELSLGSTTGTVVGEAGLFRLAADGTDTLAAAQRRDTASFSHASAEHEPSHYCTAWRALKQWQDLSPGMTLSPTDGVSPDTDDGYAVLDPPFDVRHFGTPYSHLGVSVNGMAIPMTGPAETDALIGLGLTVPVQIPSPFDPDRLVAPFYSNLSYRSTPLDPSAMHARTLGAPPTRVFGVTWSNVYSKLDAEPNSHLSLQLLLDENGVVRMQYEDLRGSAVSPRPHYGAGAAIGMEDNTGSAGNPWGASVSDEKVEPNLALLFVPCNCGDGRLDIGEQCDDGNLDDFDDCLSYCACFDGDCATLCGNGRLDGNEQCDDGNTADSSNGCAGDCTINGALAGFCGDGVVNTTAEWCDDGALNGTGEGKCAPGCTHYQQCGDGLLAGTEACDDSNTNSCDGCRGNCSAVETGCGDGFMCGAEACDDANTNSCDGCRGNCSAVETGCGDGFICGAEVCDDGNTSDCTGACRGDCGAVTGCGDARVCGVEVCDDGDTTMCVGPCNGTCAGLYCGNGAVECGEACDDANGSSDDGCNTSCQIVPANFPFLETWEGYTPVDYVRPYWSKTGTGPFRILNTAANGPFAGTRHLTMDSSTLGTNARNELTLAINLAGRYDVALRFQWRDYGDDDNAMPATFVGGSNSDGVAISTDGTNWCRVSSLVNAGTGAFPYALRDFPLDPVMAGCSLTYASPTYIRLQQYDNAPISSSDGFGFDNIEVYGPVCGNSAVETGEACDDGNTADCDGCKGDCTRPDYFCGDMIIECGEACDDGDQDSCTVACDEFCLGPSPPMCGNGTLECAEACDDGPPEGEGLCANDCSGIQACGDGIPQGTEACDDGGDGSCYDDCSALSACGDGVLFHQENCDDGDTSDCTTACNATCTGPAAPRCGNGVTDCGETCDDGDATACTAGCNATCTGPAGSPVCGNGIVDCGETCDDGNTSGGDACGPGCQWPVCGDSNVNLLPSLTSVTLEWLAVELNIAGPSTTGARLHLTVNGMVILDTPTGTNPLIGSCGPALTRSLTITSPALLSAFVPGTNNIQISMISGNGDTDRLVWGILTATTSKDSQSVMIHNGGNPPEAWNRNSNPCVFLTVVSTTPLVPYTYQTGEACDDGNVTECGLCNAACSGASPADVCGDGITCGAEACDDGNAFDCTGSCRGDCMAVTGCGDARTCGAEVCDDGNTADCTGTCRGDCMAATGCGDTRTCAPEPCDDGNADQCDACHNNCTPNLGTCGDGFVCGAEACDDGNGDNCDACHSDCTANTGCGDGDVCGAEACDDGNTGHCDGCRGDCLAVETGCGDGFQCGAEQCDDGNGNQCDTCHNDCTFNASVCGDGFACGTEVCDDGNLSDCTGTCRGDCMAVTGCGDARLCGAEVCDDGNGSNLDNCTNTCLPNTCGDGYQDLQAPGTEGCDDGNGDNCDACHNDCTSNTGCGDGDLCPGEVCDDGNTADCTGVCRGDCQALTGCGDARTCGTEQCDDANGNNCDACHDDCTLTAGCGDGDVCPGEVCDDGNTSDCTGACRGDCLAVTACGDSRVCGAEVCDDGNTLDCTGTCRGDCMAATGCGDTRTCAPEQCDDGNGSECDACHNNCTTNLDQCGDGFACGGEICDDGNTLDCTGTCRGDCGAVTGCGDGVACAPEVCDDSNTDNCLGWCRGDCMALTLCGDGFTCGSEICDDGNQDNCDICKNDCTMQTGCGDGDVCGAEVCDDGNTNNCVGACKGDCSGPVTGCGDGVLCGGEACDDGNTSDCTGVCNAACTALVTGCGDGTVCGIEVCDDGNTANCTGACRGDCSGLVTGCGDGVVCGGEVCDDGNTSDCTGTCNATCTAVVLGCGDGVVCGAEVCDDGNVSDCTGACRGDCAALTGCGDGTVCGAEVCDDGNVSDCTGACKGDCSGATTGCGDGVTCGAEVCDDGNVSDCTGSCKGDCSGPVTGCGDGVACAPETCDDGNTLDCTGACRGDCSAVEFLACGDGFVCGVEVCDDGNTANCTGPCKGDCSGLESGCGDGVTCGAEVCDDGNTMDCSGACRGDCGALTGCGDSRVCPPEVCDDGNTLDCTGTCRGDCQAVTGCGDSRTCGVEVCDDGPPQGEGFCNNLCTAIQTCGDSIANGTETCDDGALNGARNGCDLVCTGQCDPVHAFSTRFGDANEQRPYAAAVDGTGNVWITGVQYGNVDYGGGTRFSAGNGDIILAKFGPTGSHLFSALYGDANTQEVRSLAVDGAGNVWITGNFGGTVNFGGGPLVSTTTSDIFLAKFGSAGNHLFSARFGIVSGPNLQYAFSVATDGSGNVWLTGYFGNTVNFGGGGLTTAGSWDIFLAKFGPAGNHLFSTRFGGTGEERGYGLAVDGPGNVWLTGDLWGTVNFGGGPLTSGGGYDTYLAKFGPAGNHLFSARFGDASSQYGRSVAVDGSGNAWLMGYFYSTVNFGGGLLTSAGDVDIYLAKFGPAINHLFSARFGGVGSDGQFGQSVTVDPANNAWITGEFTGPANFGGGLLTSAGGTDIYMAQFAPGGSHLSSARFGDAGSQTGRGIAVDRTGNAWLTGQIYNSTVNFGGAALASAGDYDIVLAKFAPAGAPNCFVCGNGATNPGEFCDDGNTDPCTPTCNGMCSAVSNICGDGVWRCGEACDDGNLVPLDGCNSTCTGP